MDKQSFRDPATIVCMSEEKSPLEVVNEFILKIEARDLDAALDHVTEDLSLIHI